MARLTGKVALITGGGQGIGRGIASAMAAEGASVAVAGRTTQKLDDTVTAIRKRGGEAIAVECDVTDGSQVAGAVDLTVETLGGLDVLVNNAQAYCFGPLATLDVETLVQGWQSGALGSLRCMQAAYRHLCNGGVVINVSSGVTASPSAGTGAYAAVKAAIEALSRAAAVEWAADGIRVVSLIPFARTPAVQATLDAYPGVEEQILAEVPLGRFGDPETEIGAAAVFLASTEGGFITGSTLAVDGGSAYLR